MAPILATIALVHLAALAGCFVMANVSVQAVDDAGRPRTRREPEPRPGDLPDPSAYRQSLRPTPRWLA